MTDDRAVTGSLFDQVAADYQRFRPGYPDEIVDRLLAATGLTAGSRVLEVGCGTGQATRSLLARDLRVLAVEPGEHLAAEARRRLDPERFSVEVATFEDWDDRGRRFPALVSATAFHWTDPARRWTITHRVLEPGGHVALLTNRTLAGGSFDEFYDVTAEIHRRFGLGDNDEASPTEEYFRDALGSVRDIGALWAVAEWKTGPSDPGDLFGPPTHEVVPWTQTYDTAGAVGLLSTFSNYLSLPEPERQELLDEFAEVIESRFAGHLERRFLAILATAVRAD